MKRIHTIFIFAIVMSCAINAQIPTFKWTAQFGGTSDEMASSVAVDANGNVYTIGTFSNTTDFDPGAGTFTMNTNGFLDIYISKLDASGNFVWAKQIGGVANDEGRSIAVDAFGNVYFTGYFSGTVDFDPGAGVFNMTEVGNNDIYICKLSAAGNFIWAKQMGGSGIDQGVSLTVNSIGTVYSTGYFGTTVDFDPGAGTYTLASIGGNDIYVSKLDASGNFIFAKAVGGTGNDQSMGIKTDGGGNIVYTGYFSNVVDMDPGAGTFTLSTFGGGSYDAFVNKLDGNGNFTWSKQLGGLGYDASYGVAIDAFNAVYLTGTFDNTADFDPGAGTYTLAGTAPGDVFICKLDVAGNFNWANRIGGPNGDIGWSIAVDGTGVYTIGTFANTVDFDPGVGSFTLNSIGGYDAFVTKWGQCITPYAPTIVTPPQALNVCVSGTVILSASSNGTITWYTTATGNSSVAVGNNYTTPVVTVTTTYYAEALTCAPSASRTPVTITVGSTPTINITITNSVVCAGFNSKLTASGAASYTWTGGVLNGLSFYPSTTTSYTVTGKSTIGCTNTAVATITVNTGPSMTITSTSSVLCAGETATLSANGSTTSYIWSTGDSTPDAVVSPTISTTYTVNSIGTNGCVGTAVFTQSVSPCIGINELHKSNEILQVYPNPSNGNFTIISSEDIDLNIMNELGQIIKTLSLNGTHQHQILISGLPTGVYFILANSNGVPIHTKLIIAP